MKFFSIGQTNDQIPTEITFTMNQEDDAASFDGNSSMWGFSKSEQRSMKQNGSGSSQKKASKSKQLHRTHTHESNGTSSTASSSGASSSSPHNTPRDVYDYLEEYKKSFRTENMEEVDAFVGAIRDRQRKQRAKIQKAMGNFADFDP